MPLPEFRPDGWLPEGHHPTTWDEITRRFGGVPGSRRAAVLSGLLRWRDAARARGLAGLIILAGSFISQKAAPGDFDLFFLYDADAEALLKTDVEARMLCEIKLHWYCRKNTAIDTYCINSRLVKLNAYHLKVSKFRQNYREKQGS